MPRVVNPRELLDYTSYIISAAAIMNVRSMVNNCLLYTVEPEPKYPASEAIPV
jgi:hypothetical protein